MLNKLMKINREEGLRTKAPYADIVEQKNSIVLELEMPGVDKGTLDVTLDENTLTIKGTKKEDEVGKDYKPLYQERTRVEYKRAYELNVDVDREKVEAHYNDGILKVSLAKSEKAIPQKIEIKGAK